MLALTCVLDEFDKSNKAVITRDDEIEKLRSEFDLYKNAYKAVDAQLVVMRREKEEAQLSAEQAQLSVKQAERELGELKESQGKVCHRTLH